MFELMYEHQGVGLAANQVDLPYRLFITNPTGDPKTGEEHVFINPVLAQPPRAGRGRGGLPQHSRGLCRREAGGKDRRSTPTISNGQPVHLELDGLFARVVQHETDHIDGKLFIDRLEHDRGARYPRSRCGEFEDEFIAGRDAATSPATPKSPPAGPNWKDLRT